jgi:hypothetical protein
MYKTTFGTTSVWRHYLQQQDWGATPYLSLSLASLTSAGLDWRSTSSHREVWSEQDASMRGLSYFEGRMNEKQIENFKDTYENRSYYDGRFLRSFFANDIFTNFLIDVTWSK